MLNRIKSTKYISILSAMLILFTYIANLRYYISSNIFRAFNLGNLGAFGTKLTISLICVVFMSLAYVLGVLLAYFTRKKTSNNKIAALYFLSGLMALGLLIFTPYNLQLLMPSQNLQNIAMINVIAVMVFALADVLVFSWGLNLHIAKIASESGVVDIVHVGVAAVVATIFAVLTLTLSWSFTICITVYSSILMAVNILHAFVANKDDKIKRLELNKKSYIIVIVAALLALVLLLVGYFVAEAKIAL